MDPKYALPSSQDLQFISSQPNSNEHIPTRETESVSAVQNIWHILRNQKNHCSVCTRPPLDPSISQINLVHTLPSYFICLLILSSTLTLHFPSTVSSSNDSAKILNALFHFLQACYVSSPSHPP